MNKIVTFLLALLISATSFGQSIVVPTSTPTTIVWQRSSFVVDSIFRIGISKPQKPSWWNNAVPFDGAVVLNPADSQMYWYYNGWKKAVGAATDTTSLSNRIDARVKYTDTAAMLTPYFNNANYGLSKSGKTISVDTSILSGKYFRITDTANKWVNSVIKINDSTIRVIKNTTSTDITLSPTSTVTSATRLITAVYNNSGATILKGSVVYMNGAHSSNLPTIALAKANAEATSAFTYGLVQDDIPDNNQGIVIQNGSITNLNLPTSTYTAGQTLYLSPTVAGGYTTTKPLAPNHYVAIGTITRAHPTFGTIQVAIRNGFQLDELSDVQIPLVPNDSTLLQYSRTDSLWHSVSVTSAIGNKYIKPSDTAAMLAPYVHYTDTSAMLSKYLRKVDTATLSARINLKLNISDTASMLANYAKSSKVLLDSNALASNINLRVKYTDTASMLTPYLRKVDTASLSARINAKGSGTITSIATTNGTGITGGTITTSGTLAIDTTLISTRLWRQKGIDSVNTQLALKVKYTDTASMLGVYLRKVDTATLSTRIDARVKYTDTATMLANYARSNSVVKYTDTASLVAPYLRKVDTATLSSRINLKLNISDTSTMLANYAKSNVVVKYSDTATMLIPYLRKVDTASLSNRINAKGSGTITSIATTTGTGITGGTITTSGTLSIDTTLISTRLWRQKGIDSVNSQLGLKVNYTDTATMLSNYARSNAVVKYTDTATLLSPYLRKVDTATLSTRINLKLNISDTASMLTPYARKQSPTIITPLITGLSSGSTNDSIIVADASTGALKRISSSRIGGSSGWGLTGNAGTTAGTNFVGTTDNIDLVLKRNSIEKLRIASAQSTFADRLIIGSNSFTGGTFGVAANNFVFGSDATAMGSNQWRTTTGSNMSVAYLVGGSQVASYTIVNNGRFEWQSNGGYILSEGGVERLRAITSAFTFNNSSSNYDLLYKGQTNSSLFYIKASTDNVGLGTSSPNASTILDMVSTTKGFGLPSMTTTQQNAIASPRAGLAIYNNSLGYPTYYDGGSWNAFFSGWGLSGNTGTNASINFIGTTDNVDLVFKRNNSASGRIGSTNTSFGYNALSSITSGGNNTCFGVDAGKKLTVPYSNTMIGFSSGSEVISGFLNIYIGYYAGSSVSHTSGNKNIVISEEGLLPTNNGSNQLNIGNVIWGANCDQTGTAAGGQISIGANTPNASTILDLTSTTKGLGLPQMTTTQINAIASPKNGLTVYNTDLSTICFYNGSSWQKVTSSTM
jgi:hypothetical protein